MYGTFPGAQRGTTRAKVAGMDITPPTVADRTDAVAQPRSTLARRAAGLMAVAFAAAFTGACAVDEDYDPATDQEGTTSAPVLAGQRLSESQVAAALRAAGFPESEVPRMVCTARYESQWYTRAYNRNRNGSIDRGLLQINSIHVGGTRGCPSQASALYDPNVNAACGYAVWRLQGIEAWYGYRAHRAECNAWRLGR